MTNELTLHSFFTPNGRRATILLSVLNVPFKFNKVDITKGEQFSAEFQVVAPYGKIPAITDTDPITGDSISIFETGAILEFIVKKYDANKKLHYDENDGGVYWDQQKWLFFTAATLSPIQGELSHFLNFASQRDEFAIERAQQAVERVYEAMEQRLMENDGWFVGTRFNVVDVSAFAFVNRHEFVQLDVEGKYPAVWAWLLKVKNIKGVLAGYNYVE